jgi:hypothetical protein
MPPASEDPATSTVPRPEHVAHDRASAGRAGTRSASHGYLSAPHARAAWCHSGDSGTIGRPNSSSTSQRVPSGRRSHTAPMVPMSATPPYLAASLSMCPPSVGVLATSDRIRAAMCSGTIKAGPLFTATSGAKVTAYGGWSSTQRHRPPRSTEWCEGRHARHDRLGLHTTFTPLAWCCSVLPRAPCGPRGWEKGAVSGQDPRKFFERKKGFDRSCTESSRLGLDAVQVRQKP